MSAISSIEWTDRTWNPVRGCSVISPGCVNCYAMKMAHRFSGEGMGFHGLTKLTSAGPQWTGVIREHVSALNQPLAWKKPQRIFVNSMSDLFHEGVSDEYIKNVFTVMAVAKQHTFQILTKRPERMQELLSSWRADDMYDLWHGYSGAPAEIEAWPLPNVHLGISAENQPMLDARLPWLKDTKAAVRFLSCEPLLSGLDLAKHRPGTSRLWVIVGGESGAGARPCDVAWVRSIVRQCQQSDTPVFVKQLGSVPLVPAARQTHWDYRFSRLPEDRRFDAHSAERWRLHLADRKGGDPAEWPEDLRVREFPRPEAA